MLLFIIPFIRVCDNGGGCGITITEKSRGHEREECKMTDIINVAVIAGTPVDTQMGVKFIEEKSSREGDPVSAFYLPVSENCDDQTRFQYMDYAAKRARMDEIFDYAASQGIEDFFIYCNSLSGAFDFESYAVERGVRIYTPLQIYSRIAGNYRRVGVVAANNISAHKIEQTMIASNSEIYVIGTGNMAIVSAIEAGLPPEDIVRDCGIEHMVRYIEACGCEALILGCTHFPYLKEVIRGFCRIPLIDPADEMYSELLRGYAPDRG